MGDYDKILEGAVALGFKKVDVDKYECTKEQIIALCTLVAKAAIEQTRNVDKND